jgi:hypothetical protein
MCGILEKVPGDAVMAASLTQTRFVADGLPGIRHLQGELGVPRIIPPSPFGVQVSAMGKGRAIRPRVGDG